MRRIAPIVTGAAVTVLAAAARRTWHRRPVRRAWPIGRPAREPRQRWHSVTVNRPLEQATPGGQLPEPLARLGDGVEVQVRPAPADRGTEFAVRLNKSRPSGFRAMTARLGGRDPRYAVRSALRETKQLVETGQILGPDKPPTTKRTLTNRPLQFVTRHAREEGRL
jgi:hypothetical protein